MAVTTITKVGAFTNELATQINDNFTSVGSGGSFASPAITGTVTGGASYTAPTITDPSVTGTVAGGATYTTPTLTTPVVSTGLSASGSASNDFSASTGTFKTSSGTNTLSGNTALAAGKALTLSESTGIFSAGKIVPATTYTSNTTPANITGLSWTLVAGSYIFELNLPCTMTTNGGLSIAFALTTAVLTSINYQTYAATASDNSTAVSTNGTTGTSGTLVFDSVAAAYTHVNIKGAMVVGTGGTFAWQGAQHSSAGGGDVTSLLVNGYATMIRIA